MNIEDRLGYNKQILDRICKYIENNPDMRFIQALWNLNLINRVASNEIPNAWLIEDRYYEEPDKTLSKLRKE
jgi:hypothetical protein